MQRGDFVEVQRSDYLIQHKESWKRNEYKGYQSRRFSILLLGGTRCRVRNLLPYRGFFCSSRGYLHVRFRPIADIARKRKPRRSGVTFDGAPRISGSSPPKQGIHCSRALEKVSLKRRLISRSGIPADTFCLSARASKSLKVT